MGTDVETGGVAILWAPSEELPREIYTCTHMHTHTHQHNTPTQTHSHPREGLSDHLPPTADSIYAYPTGGHLLLPQYSSPQTLPRDRGSHVWGGLPRTWLILSFLQFWKS